MAILRILAAYALAALVATALASLTHTHLVLAGLQAAGAPTPPGLWLETALGDFMGLAPALGPVIAIGFAVGFGVAALLRRVLRPLAAIAYPLAGAAAMGAALAAMKFAYDGVTPLASARTALGFGMLCLSGAIGGLVFQLALGRRRG